MTGIRDRFAAEQVIALHGIRSLDVTVAHYPPGASKWNPIEHRLFSEISKNWAGRPLDSYETILNFIRTTKTKTGLKVNARLVKKQYPKGIKISGIMHLTNLHRGCSVAGCGKEFRLGLSLSSLWLAGF